MRLLQPIIRKLLLPPWRIVIVDDQRSWRGYELFMAALFLARQIEKTTKRPHIGIMLPTSGLAPLAIIATWMLGKTIVPINYLLSSRDRDYIIEHAELDTVITVTAMIDRMGDLPPQINQIRLDKLSFKGFPPFRRMTRRGDEFLAALLYTSGTSGRPKGVMLTAKNIETNVTQCVTWGKFTEKNVFLGVLPQFHCFGLTVLTLLPLYTGNKVVYTMRFVPKKILELLTTHRPHVFLAIPSMLNSLLAARSATADHFRSLHYLISGGEPLPQAVFDGYRDRFGCTLNEGYGLTETSPVANWCRPQDHKRFSVGQPLPGVEEKIVSPAGKSLGIEEEGEICIRGANVMKGYYKQSEATAAVFDGDGFFRTGDMGRIDGDGHLFITGRIKEMLVIGGENVAPRAIEETLNSHPGVTESAVIGIQDRSRGEVPIAFVEAREEALDVMAGLDAQLRAHCREHMAAYMVPQRVIIVSSLPRNGTGKILRRELRELLPEELQHH
jgi:long-chain acyl-CoA synthetase